VVWAPAAAQDRPDVWYRMRPADPLPCAVQADPVPADQAHRAVLGRAGAGQRGRDRGRTGIQRRATRGRGLISDGLAWVDLPKGAASMGHARTDGAARLCMWISVSECGGCMYHVYCMTGGIGALAQNGG
jgi:hypothetical protein